MQNNSLVLVYSSMNCDKYMKLCYHYQNHIHCSQPPPPQPPAIVGLSFVPIVLSFLGCHINGITQYVAF